MSAALSFVSILLSHTDRLCNSAAGVAFHGMRAFCSGDGKAAEWDPALAADPSLASRLDSALATYSDGALFGALATAASSSPSSLISMWAQLQPPKIVRSGGAAVELPTASESLSLAMTDAIYSSVLLGAMVDRVCAIGADPLLGGTLSPAAPLPAALIEAGKAIKAARGEDGKGIVSDDLAIAFVLALSNVPGWAGRSKLPSMRLEIPVLGPDGKPAARKNGSAFTCKLAGGFRFDHSYESAQLVKAVKEAADKASKAAPSSAPAALPQSSPDNIDGNIDGEAAPASESTSDSPSTSGGYVVSEEEGAAYVLPADPAERSAALSTVRADLAELAGVYDRAVAALGIEGEQAETAFYALARMDGSEADGCDWTIAVLTYVGIEVSIEAATSAAQIVNAM